ncbi:MAG: hypothetical protein AAGA42_12810 [Actinomycetota bacterium]
MSDSGAVSGGDTDGDGAAPALPAGVADAPAIAARPSGAPLPPPAAPESAGDDPSIPPLPPLPADGTVQQAPPPPSTGDFVPLRSDPPPSLFATWWLRYMLALSLLVAIGATLAVEYASGPGGLYGDPVVVAPHVLVALLLMAWSILAMVDVERIAPARRYQRRARGSVVGLLWVLAFAAPVAAAAVIDGVRTQFDQPGDDGWALVAACGAVLVAFVVVWLPFRYIAQHGRRVGAPTAILIGWFWLSLVALVGSLTIVALGLGDALGDNGLTAAERTIQLGVAYGVPMFVFTLATWRATTVIDEVVDLRWRRWRAEWDQTLAEMSAQPPPPPER